MMWFKVKDAFGLHARSTGKLLRFLDELGIEGKLHFENQQVGLDSIIDIMKLSIAFGDVFSIEISRGDTSIIKSEAFEVFLDAIGIEMLEEGRIA